MISLRGILILALCIALIVSLRLFSPLAASQRCAGSIDYLIRDDKGEIISASQITFAPAEQITFAPADSADADYIRGQVVRGLYRSSRAFEPLNPKKQGDRQNNIGSEPESLRFHTGCGMNLIRVELEYRNVMMTLHFKNIPAEWNFYVDSLPFQDGTFEIDFRSKGSVDWPSGLEQMSAEEKGKNIYLKELTESLVISAKEWKRVK